MSAIKTRLFMLTWLWGIISGCQQAIPPEYLSNSVSGSERLLNAQEIGRWSNNLPSNATLNYFQVRTTSGDEEIRVFLRPGTEDTGTVYAGKLTSIFPGAPIQVVLLDVKGERYIAGYIDDAIPGTLETIAFERYETDPSRWTEATKTSDIRERLFLVPISAEETRKWEAVQRITISTRESLKAMHDEIGVAKSEQRLPKHDGSAWSQVYDPAINISTRFIHPYD